jgi:hypothetical protein
MSETIVPFLADTCAIPPVLFGTGYLYIVDGSALRDLGNFSLVDVIEDAEATRIFRGSSEIASPLAVTGAWRIVLTGDSFSPAQIARLVNEDLSTVSEGDQINLRTVREIPTYQLKFRKWYPLSAGCDTECYFDIDFWVCYHDPAITYTFSQDEQTVHVFNFIAIPDAVEHPNNPFGAWTFTCPMGEGESYATGGGQSGDETDHI